MIAFPLGPEEAAVAAYVVRLVETLTAERGNVRAAAEVLAMSEHTLRHRMRDLGITRWNRKAHPLTGRRRRGT